MLENLRGLISRNPEPPSGIPAGRVILPQLEEGLVVPDQLISDAEIRKIIGIFAPLVYQPLKEPPIEPEFKPGFIWDVSPRTHNGDDWMGGGYGHRISNSRFGGDDNRKIMDGTELAVWNQITPFEGIILGNTKDLYVPKVKEVSANQSLANRGALIDRNSRKSDPNFDDSDYFLNSINLAPEDLEPFDPTGMNYCLWAGAFLSQQPVKFSAEPPFDVNIAVGIRIEDALGRRAIFYHPTNQRHQTYEPFFPVRYTLRLAEGRPITYLRKIDWPSGANFLYEPDYSVRSYYSDVPSPRKRSLVCTITDLTKIDETAFVELDGDREMRLMFWQINRALKSEINPLLKGPNPSNLIGGSNA